MLVKGRKAVVLGRETKPGWNAEFDRGVVRAGDGNIKLEDNSRDGDKGCEMRNIESVEYKFYDKSLILISYNYLPIYFMQIKIY